MGERDKAGKPEGQAPVTLTAKATERVRELLADNRRVGHGIRVSIRDGGCSGFSYVMDLASAPSAGDVVVEHGGATLFVDQAAIPYLKGTTIDYVTGLHHAGFRFLNPQATRTCGCGESFTV